MATARITSVGAQVELSPQKAVKATHVGAYVELEEASAGGGPMALSGLSGQTKQDS